MKLRRVTVAEVSRLRKDPVDAETAATVARIVSEVREGGLTALTRIGRALGDIQDDRLYYGKEDLDAALAALPVKDARLLERVAGRIHAYALAQKASLTDMELAIEGGMAGHTVAPVAVAGCYAPGGRYPLPSSALMTAVTARAAGVETVWLASPNPSPITLAAAAVAEADGLLAVGGAQAIAALAYGIDLGGGMSIPPCDIVVGPGNRWVTAAKQLVFGQVAIDMLAGPSELVVAADEDSDARLVAADLLAQAEHDPDAVPILVSTSEALVLRVQEELGSQLQALSTADVARESLRTNGLAVVVAGEQEMAEVCDRLAPEHLHIHATCAADKWRLLKNYGALFIGETSAEAFGDYGAGPNHVLPTGGTSRYAGGLSVLTFLRVRTWMRLDSAGPLLRDTAALARLEGLEAHARSAEARLKDADR